MDAFDSISMPSYLAQTAPSGLQMAANVTPADMMLPLDAMSNFDNGDFVG